MGAAKLLKEKIPSIFWTSCATHTINLMLEGIGALPRFKKILDQAKKLTIFIYAHHKSLAMMRSYTNKREIIRPGVTRFASTFLTLQSLAEKKEQLRHMFSSTEWEECKFSSTPKGIASYKTVSSVQFWSGVAQCLKVFSPLVKVLRMVDADWKPSMGFVYGEIKVAKEEIITSLGASWWGLFGGTTPHLTKIAMRILSLTSSSSGCERNWSTFERVHTKIRDRLEESKLNNLVYVQFNANLMEKKPKAKR
ncbi:unnamed protein product [Lactuca virosa]|uniref:HAT C-terminal dimerisation domain-containing protein n=1 Tax=Lactuca virosa TaxID=75947 RepID=A0AAU9LBC5_9ASTR|nr:unnamed protein product [Lactuca virosa]